MYFIIPGNNWKRYFKVGLSTVIYATNSSHAQKNHLGHLVGDSLTVVDVFSTAGTMGSARPGLWPPLSVCVVSTYHLQTFMKLLQRSVWLKHLSFGMAHGTTKVASDFYQCFNDWTELNSFQYTIQAWLIDLRVNLMSVSSTELR